MSARKNMTQAGLWNKVRSLPNFYCQPFCPYQYHAKANFYSKALNRDTGDFSSHEQSDELIINSNIEVTSDLSNKSEYKF